MIIRTDVYSVIHVADIATVHEWLAGEDAITDRRWGIFGPQLSEAIPITPGVPMPISYQLPPSVTHMRVHIVMRLDSGIAVSYTEYSTVFRGSNYTLIIDSMADKGVSIHCEMEPVT